MSRIKALVKSFAAAVFIGGLIGLINVLFEKIFPQLFIKR